MKFAFGFKKKKGRFHVDFVALSLGRWRGPKTKSTEENKERWKTKN